MEGKEQSRFSRRALLRGGAVAVAAHVLQPLAAFAQSSLTKENIESDGVEFTDELISNFPDLLAVVNAVNGQFPSTFEMIRLTRSGHSYSGTKHEKGKRMLEIDETFIMGKPGKKEKPDQEVLRDIVFHEAGHIAYDLMYSAHPFNSAEYVQSNAALKKLHTLLTAATIPKNNLGRAAEWFVQRNYLEKDGGVPFGPLPPIGEFFASAFAIQTLYKSSFRKKYNNGALAEKVWADDVLKLLPQSNEFLKRRIES